ncbi:hypothetical protein JXA84_01740 [candidate division WOR-3 bacterium]|nr:hypothetical protein [candidate division WOR-3 bacterium]
MDKKLKTKILVDFLRKNLKGENIGEIMSYLDVVGISQEELEQDVFSLIPRFYHSVKGESISDDRLLLLMDNLTDGGMMHFLQVWDSGMLDERDVDSFIDMVENRREEKMSEKAVEIILNGFLINKD